MPRPGYLYALTLGLLLTACSDPQCPRGMVQTGKICRKCEPGFTPKGGVCRPDVGDATIDPVAVDDDAEVEWDWDAEVEVEVDAGLDGSASVPPDGSIGDPDSAMPPCSPSACAPGTCGEAANSPYCECPENYELAGTSCVDVNECTTTNACTAEYPCTNTNGGYVCLGQMADWPMPDSIAGSKVAPSYDTSTPGITVDRITGLVWQKAVDSSTYSLAGAATACAQLALGTKTDWRLPSKIELESLLDHSRLLPSIDVSAFPNTPNGAFWSSSPVTPATGSHWIVSFEGGGSLANSNASDQLFVRCVRGQAPASGRPAQRYVADMLNNTVLDKATGLVWERAASGLMFDNAGAIAHCASRRLRVPTSKELLTLFDPSLAAPAIRSSFPGALTSSYWSSTPNAFLSGSVLVVGNGGVGASGPVSLPVRCVGK